MFAAVKPSSSLRDNAQGGGRGRAGERHKDARVFGKGTGLGVESPGRILTMKRFSGRRDEPTAPVSKGPRMMRWCVPVAATALALGLLGPSPGRSSADVIS